MVVLALAGVALAVLALPSRWPLPAVLAMLQLLADLVVAAELAAEEDPEAHLRSRPSFSAAMARTTP